MISAIEIKKIMKQDAKKNGYFLCPDTELLGSLLEGLQINTKRFGYYSCPCRIGIGIKTYDSDIICPCEYRDADVNEFGMCYCGLFVNEEIKNKPSLMGSIPERRPIEIQDAAIQATQSKNVDTHKKKKREATISLKVPIWRCTVCGYLCARDLPPPICPICKAKAERFEPFMVK